nr:uncharacterized protein LOC129011310 [Pongo pygmaeus]
MIVEIPRLQDVDLVLHQTAELAATRPNSTVYPKITTLEHARSSLESATCARVLLLALQRARRLQGRRSNRAVPLSVPPLPVEQSGPRRRWRERAASAPPERGQRDRGLRAPPLLHRWLRAPLGSAGLGSGALARLADFPSSSAAAPISRPLSPSPRDSPTPWARAHPYTHTRRRACARPRDSSRGVSSAPQQIPALPGATTHTGFQPPRGVLCLLQRRRRRRWRRQRERRLQPGRVYQLRARDRVREKQRRRRTPRLGGAAPRPAPHSAQRVASAPHTAAPGFHPPALHPFSSSLGGLRSAAGRKLSSPPRLRGVLLLFVTVPSRGELGHLGQVFVGGSAPCLAQREVKEALGQPDSAAARVQSPRLGRWTPAASPPLWTRHVRASHGRGPSQTTPCPPRARPQPPHRLDTRGSRVLIG